MKEKELIEKAIKAREFSYAPYSKFKVGAALEGEDGEVYQGCNIENAAYTPCNCAERTALFKAVSEGKRKFKKIAVVGWSAQEEKAKDYCPPCGVCRQVLREFVNPKEFQIVVAKNVEDYKVYTLEELLPESFGPENLK